jgi:hypothetical protein
MMPWQAQKYPDISRSYLKKRILVQYQGGREV